MADPLKLSYACSKFRASQGESGFREIFWKRILLIGVIAVVNVLAGSGLALTRKTLCFQ